MEPNNTNTQDTLSATQSDATANAEATAPVAPVEPAAPNPAVSAATPDEPKAEDKKKKNNAMLVALILCLVLALGGVGFGIWAMVDGNARVDNLNTEVASLKSEKAELEQQIADINSTPSEVKEWASTEVRNGVFYVFDANGETIAQSEASWPAINEVKECKPSDDNTLLTCTVDTVEGEAQLMYDAKGNSFGFVIGPKE